MSASPTFSHLAIAALAIALSSCAQRAADRDSAAANSSAGNAMTAPVVVKSAFEQFVASGGAISIPVSVDYRRDWALLGVNAVGATNGKGIAEFHVTYAEPATVQAFRTTGRFPDKAVIIKELQEVRSGSLTTGHVTWGARTKGWFVMVKDTQNRFPTNSLWSKGWGWSYFDAASPQKTTSRSFLTDCMGCHAPAQNTDWLYVDNYPALRGAAPGK